jgi:molybdopterin adenylyltransferase
MLIRPLPRQSTRVRTRRTRIRSKASSDIPNRDPKTLFTVEQGLFWGWTASANELKTRPNCGIIRQSATVEVSFRMINVAILAISSAAASGAAMDFSGPAVRDCLPKSLFHIKEQMVLEEDKVLIQTIIEKWCKPDSDVQLIITTGGTGISRIDVTPEAVLPLLDMVIPGIPEAIRAAALLKSPRAMLSRGVAGVRGRTLIVSVQGNPQFAREAMTVILPALRHAVTQVSGEHLDTA